MTLAQSDVVRVRRSRWQIADIRAYDGCEVISLRGLGPDNAGVERHVLTPFDRVERVARSTHASWIDRRAWRRTCRSLLAGDTAPGGLRCATRARFDLMPHQLEPALAMLRGLGARVLLADEVGLGKTIQAGLIVAELMAAHAVERVLVVTPAGLRDQWRRELADRLALQADVIDPQALGNRIAALPPGTNPWTTVPVAIVSIDFIKRTEILPSAAAARWDAVVVDEAHGVAGDNDRHRAIATLAARAAFVVLVTATPHNGDRRTFESLCGLGAVADDRLMVFRRTRHDVHLGTTRRVHRLVVRLGAEELRMHELLERFTRAVRRDRAREARTPSAAERTALSLALSVLQKRAWSSPRSLQRSIERRLAALTGQRATEEEQLALPLEDERGELTMADDVPAWSSLVTLRDAARERAQLSALAASAAAATRREAKIVALGRLLRRLREPAIVFTEYRDTLVHLRDSIGLPCVVLHGGLGRDERRTALEAFTSGRSPLLLATDAAGEGLNLHQTCRTVINLELPWNPMRLEQRVGRVDRIGQRRTVHAFHLIAGGSAEPSLLSRLQRRLATASDDIAVANPLGGQPAAPGEPRSDSSIGDSRWPSASVSTIAPTLAAEAIAEAARIARARQLFRSGDDDERAWVEARGISIAKARHRRTRTWLAGRALTLWRIAAEDASGHLVGSTHIGIAFALRNKERATTTAVREEIPRVRVQLGAVAEGAGAEWRTAMAASAEAFAQARRTREDAIASVQRGHRPRPTQSGLFDRRADEARNIVAGEAAAVERELAARRHALVLAGTLSFPEPQLLLVLVP